EFAGGAIDEGCRASAKLRARLENEHAQPSFGQQTGRAQAGKARPDDDGVGGHRRGRSIVRAHVAAAISARRGRGMRTTDENTSYSRRSMASQIGRASCRERWCVRVAPVAMYT